MPNKITSRVRYWRFYIATLPRRLYLYGRLAWLYLGIHYRLLKAAYLNWRAERLRTKAIVLESEAYRHRNDTDGEFES